MIFGEKYHRWFFIFGLFLMAASLSLGKFLIGTSLFTIVINWFLEAKRPDPIWIHYRGKWNELSFKSFFKDLLELNFKPKWRLFRARPSIAFLMGIFVLHFIGILWSPDYHSGWNDIRVKLALLLVPLVIGTTAPLSKKLFEQLILTFIIAVLISSIVTVLVANGIYHPRKPVHDLREASIFVSLIRLSLMCCLSVFFLARWIFRPGTPAKKIGSAILICWFIWFMQYMQSLTGIVILFVGGFILLTLMAFIYRKRKLAIVLVSFFGLGVTLGGYYSNRFYKELFTVRPINIQQLETHTKYGHAYQHKPKNAMIENGNQVMLYLCWVELDSVWNQRSKIVLNGGTDVNGNPISMTLLRYLTSKGLRKDADGLSKLSGEEIVAIENGATNALDATRSPLERRLYQVSWEIYHYMHGANPSGNSVTMRLELARTALTCIQQHPWIGIGTGGQQKTFEKIYDKEGTKLEEDYQWLHSHNQFLSVGVCLGIPALLYFIFSLWFVPRSMKRWRSYLYLAFFLVFFMSCFDDDTLETSQGVSFYAFFNALLLYAMPRESAILTNEEDRKNNND